jgi:uncharacterized protein YbaP (TraB family)
MLLGKTVRAAFEASDHLAVELDLGDANIWERWLKSWSDENDTPLPASLSNRIRSMAERVCFSLSLMDKMFPEMKTAALSNQLLRYHGIYGEYGIDSFLLNFARGGGDPSPPGQGLRHAQPWRSKKMVVSLENVETHMRAARHDSREERIAFVAEALDSMETGRSRDLQLRIMETWAESRSCNFASWRLGPRVVMMIF